MARATLREALSDQVTGLSQEFRDAHATLGGQVGDVRATLASQIGTLRATLGKSVVDLNETLGSHAADIGHRVNELHATLEARTGEIGASLATHATGIDAMLGSGAAELDRNLSRHAGDMREALETRSHDIETSLTTHVEALREILDRSAEGFEGGARRDGIVEELRPPSRGAAAGARPDARRARRDPARPCGFGERGARRFRPGYRFVRHGTDSQACVRCWTTRSSASTAHSDPVPRKSTRSSWIERWNSKRRSRPQVAAFRDLARRRHERSGRRCRVASRRAPGCARGADSKDLDVTLKGADRDPSDRSSRPPPRMLDGSLGARTNDLDRSLAERSTRIEETVQAHADAVQRGFDHALDRLDETLVTRREDIEGTLTSQISSLREAPRRDGRGTVGAPSGSRECRGRDHAQAPHRGSRRVGGRTDARHGGRARRPRPQPRRDLASAIGGELHHLFEHEGTLLIDLLSARGSEVAHELAQTGEALARLVDERGHRLVADIDGKQAQITAAPRSVQRRGSARRSIRGAKRSLAELSSTSGELLDGLTGLIGRPGSLEPSPGRTGRNCGAQTSTRPKRR